MTLTFEQAPHARPAALVRDLGVTAALVTRLRFSLDGARLSFVPFGMRAYSGALRDAALVVGEAYLAQLKEQWWTLATSVGFSSSSLAALGAAAGVGVGDLGGLPAPAPIAAPPPPPRLPVSAMAAAPPTRARSSGTPSSCRARARSGSS